MPGPESSALPPAGFEFDDDDGALSGVDTDLDAAGVVVAAPPCIVLMPPAFGFACTFSLLPPALGNSLILPSPLPSAAMRGPPGQVFTTFSHNSYPRTHADQQLFTASSLVPVKQ